MHPQGQADRWPTEAGQLPEWHPDALRRRRFRWLRRLTRRRYDSVMGRLDRMDGRHEQDFKELWVFLAELAERPDSAALRQILDEVQALRAEVAALDQRVTKVVRALHHNTGEVSKVTGEILGDD